MKQQTRKILIINIGIWSSILLILSIVIPGILVKEFSVQEKWDFLAQPSVPLDDDGPDLTVPVYLTEKNIVQHIPLEHYVRGVLAAEMPTEFELEALKAQAIAARTYIVRRMMKQDVSGVPVEQAIVTDSELHQVFLTEEDMRERWGIFEYSNNLNKLNRAVNETKHLVATYHGEPIQATFFSTSNGYTENSEDYWQDKIPYLRSVPSPWDAELSPRYKQTTDIKLNELYDKLKISSIPATTQSWNILERTEGKRIKQINIGGKQFTGREIREALGLPSSLFQWTVKGDTVTFTTFGYGHGVGMSQWGAQGMASEGRSAEEILEYYYQGVAIESFEGLEAESAIMAWTNAMHNQATSGTN